MSLTVQAFRNAFPAFPAEAFPDGIVFIRLTLADKFFSPSVWTDDDVRNHVMGLYVAHFLTVAGSKASGGSGREGSSIGLVASKSVDGASISYDNATTAQEGAGFWNASIYGRELYQLMQLFGAGARQI